MPRRRRKRDPQAIKILAIGRLRRAVAVASLLVLAATGVCVASSGAYCIVPVEWHLPVWAGAIGTYIGLTIRLVRERRIQERSGRT